VYDPAEVGLLWIDAEHHEAHILAGASKLIEGGAPVVFEWDPMGLDREGENRERIGAALGDHYTHFVDTKLTDEPGATFRLRPIAELASHVHSGQAGGAAHSTDVLVLRLAPDQVPAPDVLDALVAASRGKTAIVEDDAAGDGVVEGD
jgi:hypothetical protein